MTICCWRQFDQALAAYRKALEARRSVAAYQVCVCVRARECACVRAGGRACAWRACTCSGMGGGRERESGEGGRGREAGRGREGDRGRRGEGGREREGKGEREAGSERASEVGRE